MSASVTALPPDSQRFSIADYRQFGRRHGFEYRLPEIDGQAALRDDTMLAEGRIDEIPLTGGITLVVSDVMNHRHYQASSEMAPGFTSIVMLDGHADAMLSGRKALRLRAQGAFSATHGQTVSMRGEHPAGLRMRSVALIVRYAQLEDSPAAAPLAALADSRTVDLRHWRASPGLLFNLDHLLERATPDTLGRIWCEGVGYQFLAEALSGLQMPDDVPATSLSPRDRTLVARVHDVMVAQPEDEHSLESLARLACMSPSSLQQKFHLSYGQSVIDFLREHRLRLAHAGLSHSGWTVQQASERCGYRHASNFATAFRRRFGVSPRALKVG